MTNREAAKVLLSNVYRAHCAENRPLFKSEEEYLDAICMAIYALMKQEEQHGKHEEKKPVWHHAKTDKPIANGDYYIIREEMPDHIYTAHYNVQAGLWTGKGCMYDDVAQWTEYRELMK